MTPCLGVQGSLLLLASVLSSITDKRDHTVPVGSSRGSFGISVLRPVQRTAGQRSQRHPHLPPRSSEIGRSTARAATMQAAAGACPCSCARWGAPAAPQRQQQRYQAARQALQAPSGPPAAPWRPAAHRGGGGGSPGGAWRTAALAPASSSSMQLSSMDEEEWVATYGQAPLRYGISLEQGARETMEDAAQVVPHGRCGFFFASAPLFGGGPGMGGCLGAGRVLAWWGRMRRAAGRIAAALLAMPTPPAHPPLAATRPPAPCSRQPCLTATAATLRPSTCSATCTASSRGCWTSGGWRAGWT